MTNKIHRRDILKTGISVACAVSSAPLAVAARAASAPTSAMVGQTATGNRLVTLTKALRSIGGDICIDAAERLESLSVSTTTFNLHLRQAGLGTSDAELLADALQSLKIDDGTSLNSFSLSYNAGIGDEGASLIANSLPTNLPDLGMAGCGLGDASGDALLRWARQAPDLHTMCIEQNRFSDGLRVRFSAFGLRRANILMVV
jgi:Ran GTPase-activating protein (RanGAP) involved in mRNA processing and transport